MISEEIESVQNEADEIEAGWGQSIWPLAMQLRCVYVCLVGSILEVIGSLGGVKAPGEDHIFFPIGPCDPVLLI